MNCVSFASFIHQNNKGGLLPSPMSSRRKNVVILLALSMDHLFMEIYGQPRSPNASNPPRKQGPTRPNYVFFLIPS